jgi:8-oxo-dGTP pyrophosphatase MutT (NUDIX family)
MQRQYPRSRAAPISEVPTINAVSAGGVVLSGPEGDFDVALVTPNHRRVWCLPKGTLEAGESAEEAAVREVREETGLHAEIVEKIDQINYWFYTPARTRVHKVVHFFLMRSLGGDVYDHDREIAEVRLFPLLEAPELLAYRGERGVVEQAIDRLLGPTGRIGAAQSSRS